MPEWENAWTERTELKKLTRAVEKNAELRSAVGKLRRKLGTRVGQVTNSHSELEKLADAIYEIIAPSPAHPSPVHTALLFALSKYLLLLAETELVVARGHGKLWDILWARFVGRMSGWGVAVYLKGRPGTSETEWRKIVGRELEGTNDPDNKRPTPKTASSTLTEWWATRTLRRPSNDSYPSQIQLESVPPPLWIT
ncbi:unnamed protein product [Rhizoctonia solani]|nr:unnamed protein product [Rhizoctonia solani]